MIVSHRLGKRSILAGQPASGPPEELVAELGKQLAGYVLRASGAARTWTEGFPLTKEQGTAACYNAPSYLCAEQGQSVLGKGIRSKGRNSPACEVTMFNKNSAALGWCFLVLLVSAGSSRANFKYTQSSKLTGGALAGMMKVAGVFSKQAREPIVSTEYLKGHKMRRDSSDGHSTIIDLDGRQIIEIDNNKRLYSVMTFDQMRQRMEEAKAQAQQQVAQQNKSNPQPANVKLTPKLSVADGPGTRTIAGLPTHEVKVDLEMLIEGTDPNQPAQSGQVQTWVKSDEYLTPSLPGSDQVLEFQRAMAKELGWVPGEMFGGNVQVSSSMAELHKNSANIKGFPLLQYTSMGIGAPGQPNASNPNATAQGQQQPQQQSSGLGDISSPGQAAAKAIGGMFRHKKQQDQDQTASTGASPSGAAPSEPGALMEMTVEVTSYSNDALDDSLFASPAGYTQAPNLNPVTGRQ